MFLLSSPDKSWDRGHKALLCHSHRLALPALKHWKWSSLMPFFHRYDSTQFGWGKLFIAVPSQIFPHRFYRTGLIGGLTFGSLKRRYFGCFKAIWRSNWEVQWGGVELQSPWWIFPCLVTTSAFHIQMWTFCAFICLLKRLSTHSKIHTEIAQPLLWI